MTRERQIKKDWLNVYQNDYIIRQESPSHYHFWVGTQLISTALRRNIWVDRGAYKVFPNQFIFLVANSGRCRKSKAMDIGLDLITEVDGLNIIAGRATVEGLIDNLANSTKVDADVQKVDIDGSCLIYADELSFLFGKASYITDLISFLTAAYTGKSRLDFLTRGRGMVKVRNPCPNIIAGTTPQQMGEIFPSMTIYSGFMARVLLIYGTSAQSRRIAKPQLNHELEDLLIHDLGVMSELRGPVELDEEAEDFYVKWYEELPLPKVPELEAFHERKHDHVLKAALNLSIAESNELVIKIHHLISAIERIEEVELSTPMALSYIGATSQSMIRDLVFRNIKSVFPDAMNHSTALRRVYKKLSNGAVEFNLIIDQLLNENLIEHSVRGATSMYKYKEPKDK